MLSRRPRRLEAACSDEVRIGWGGHEAGGLTYRRAGLVSFNLINMINVLAVACLILMNVIAYRKDLSDSFNSKYFIINILEQVGRYGCMALMVLPIFTRGWEFGFASATEMLIWASLTIVLLVMYGFLWGKKAHGGAGILYALAVVPAILFLMNGILLCHPTLVAISLVFGIFHFLIVKENIRSGNKSSFSE